MSIKFDRKKNLENDEIMKKKINLKNSLKFKKYRN
jgi:hypothetical protein